MTTNPANAKKVLNKIRKTSMTFGRMLCSLRISDDISQVDLARKAKVSKGLICDIEKGRRDASIELAINLARIMGYAPESFVSILLEEQIHRAKLFYKIKLEKAA
jgi:DNA-binding XRE family transcriptional regulator